ncbi:MAG: hypothetical protein KC443_02410 [Anaerolineales bacterium]|nr:hypothetical protein [Anaerolineales bacterium]
MTRIKGIIAAGTLTGLVLLTVLALGFRNAGAAKETTVNTATAVTTPQQLQDMQTYTTQLEDALQTMQAREAQYQQQIEAANQTIHQLQSQSSTAPTGNYWSEHEEHEHGDYDD